MPERIFLDKEQHGQAKLLVEAKNRAETEAAYQSFVARLASSNLESLINTALMERALDITSSVKFDVSTGELILEP